MKYIFIAVVAMIAIAACKTTKSTAKNAPKVTEAVPEPKPYTLDTITSIKRIDPEKGHSMVIENLQFYFVAQVQPAVGVRVIQENGEVKHYMLPQLQNAESYSFGGAVKIPIAKGAHAIIDAFDGQTRKPITGRLIVGGKQQ